jgi:hypothetical protein
MQLGRWDIRSFGWVWHAVDNVLAAAQQRADLAAAEDGCCRCCQPGWPWLLSQQGQTATLMAAACCLNCSHDRAFMESCCSQLLELDHGGFTAMHPFGGNGSYDAFKGVSTSMVKTGLRQTRMSHIGSQASAAT